MTEGVADIREPLFELRQVSRVCNSTRDESRVGARELVGSGGVSLLTGHHQPCAHGVAGAAAGRRLNRPKRMTGSAASLRSPSTVRSDDENPFSK